MDSGSGIALRKTIPLVGGGRHDMSDKVLRVLVVDDHPILLAGLKTLIETTTRVSA